MNKNIAIEIFNSSNAKKLPKKKIMKAVEYALTADKFEKAEIAIIFVDDKYMKNLNNKFLGHNYCTDVLTFPMDSESLSGEIYISYSTALKQAREFNVSATNEMMRLAVHGTLHLMGYNDDTPANKGLMHSLQEIYIYQE